MNKKTVYSPKWHLALFLALAGCQFCMGGGGPI
jgi:hypothetical protein